MIRNPGKRMTVAQLKQQMDRRFDQQSARMDTRFDSVSEKLDAIFLSLKRMDDHHQQILTEHDNRLTDLETWRRTSQDIAR